MVFMRAKAKSDGFTAASSCCRQKHKFENFSRRLAAYVNDIFLNACCMCSTIIFSHSTKQIFDL